MALAATPDTNQLALLDLELQLEGEMDCESPWHAPGPDHEPSHRGPGRYMALIGCARCGKRPRGMILCEPRVAILLRDLGEDRGVYCSGCDRWDVPVDVVYHRFVAIDTMRTIWASRRHLEPAPDGAA
jgi:hypothetical protein